MDYVIVEVISRLKIMEIMVIMVICFVFGFWIDVMIFWFLKWWILFLDVIMVMFVGIGVL